MFILNDVCFLYLIFEVIVLGEIFLVLQMEVGFVQVFDNDLGNDFGEVFDFDEFDLFLSRQDEGYK